MRLGCGHLQLDSGDAQVHRGEKDNAAKCSYRRARERVLRGTCCLQVPRTGKDGLSLYLVVGNQNLPAGGHTSD